MALIRLRGKYATGNHTHAIVDDDLFEYLDQWRWVASPSSNGKKAYAVRGTTIDGKSVLIRMHRLVLSLKQGKKYIEWDGVHDVDHISREPQYNRATNLRWLTRSENVRNQEGWTDYQLRCSYCGTSFSIKTTKKQAEAKHSWCGDCEKPKRTEAEPACSRVEFRSCEQCSVPFVVRPRLIGKQRFCTRKCKERGKDQRLGRSRAVNRQPKVCPWCTTTFIPPRKDSVYCSRECGDKHRWAPGGAANLAWKMKQQN